jgi:hypothetical protein
MPFRVSGHDLVSGRPCAPYETHEVNEAEAHAEAERLGVRISGLEPIASLAARDQADALALSDWSWPRLDWRTTRWSLLRLGLEHPRWGKVLATTASVAALIGRIKVVPMLLATLAGAGLAAAGLGSDPETLGGIMLLATPLVPILVAKPLVYRHLRKVHAADGFDRERRLRVSKGSTHWFDGQCERPIAGEVAEIFDLRHSILLRCRDGGEIAIPVSCFDSPPAARHFAERLAALHEVKLRTSPWSSKQRGDSAVQNFFAWIWFALIGTMLMFLILLLGWAFYSDLTR